MTADEAETRAKLEALSCRLRLAFLEGAEEQSRGGAGRSLTVEELGRTQKTLDLDVSLPSTGERAFIQVKSATSDAELAEYVAQLEGLGPYARMFFVYHTGVVHDPGDERVVVIGPDKLAELVVDAGLVGWLIGKAS